MKEKIRKYLPIGSVIRIRKTDLRFVITAYLQEAELEDHKETVLYDYAGVPYPFGYVGDETVLQFQQEDIEEVLHRGYEDNARRVFIDRLAAAEKDARDEELHMLENL